MSTLSVIIVVWGEKGKPFHLISRALMKKRQHFDRLSFYRRKAYLTSHCYFIENIIVHWQNTARVTVNNMLTLKALYSFWVCFKWSGQLCIEFPTEKAKNSCNHYPHTQYIWSCFSSVLINVINLKIVKCFFYNWGQYTAKMISST